MGTRSTLRQSSEEVAALNDRLAREHSIDDYYERSLFIVRAIEQRRLAIIRKMVGPPAGLRILEVGSGGGHVLRMFPEARLTAVDVSEVFLDTAKRNLKGYDVEFHLGELGDLDLPQASYDRVICTEVLEHTRAPDEILSQIRRLLKPEGRAVITVPVDPLIDGLKKVVRLTPAGWLLRHRINWGGDEYHLHRWWPRQFERLLGRDFIVQDREASPVNWFPLRACFACRRR